MDQHRFDALARSLGGRHSRRAAITSSVAILAGAALGANAAAAQGTPTPGEELAADDGTLFVQTAASGTFVPNSMATPGSGTQGAYLLTLNGHAGQTIGFSDRPQRNFGQLPTATFLDVLGFTPDNPPNAALVVSTPAGEDDILVLELLHPTFDSDAGSLTYEANILAEYAGEMLSPVADRQQDDELATDFAHASLFIDDCPDANPLNCLVNCTSVGNLGNRGMCWNWSAFQCQPCDGGWAGTAAECDNTFSACNGSCHTDICIE